jgi:hypothetical protein
MTNWKQIEDELSSLLMNDYYRQQLHIADPRKLAHDCVFKAQGSLPPTYSGDVTVNELQHPSRPGHPTRLVRGFDTSRSSSEYGPWWIDYELFERFGRATSSMSPSIRGEKIRAFMRARSAVTYGWNAMDGLAEFNLPLGSRMPAIVGKTHYQPINTVSDPKDPAYAPNVFFMGGDLQFFVCVRPPEWIRPRPKLC